MTSLIILLWACGSVIGLGLVAIQRIELVASDVVWAILFAPIALVAGIIFVLLRTINILGKKTIWRKE